MPFPCSQIANPHVCPMVTGVVPHVGGVIAPPGAITALVGKMPAAQMTGMTICVGPPGTIVRGSPKCLVGKLPAAHLTSNTAHGGVVTFGFPTVLV